METIDQLRRHLKDNGYSQFIMIDEPDRVAVYDLRLEKYGGGWRVFETERGQEVATYAETLEESEAVRIFFEMVSERIYLLKSYKDAANLEKIEAALRLADVPFKRNDVPYEGKLRVFVTGSNLRKAQNVAVASGG
ncbi:hypothetical protein [Sphingomonas oryzagri]